MYRFATDFCKLMNLPYRFNTDQGNYETAIIFDSETHIPRLPLPTESFDNISYPSILKCPDLADFNHKILIEYEEETGPRKPGSKYAKKGHGHPQDYGTKRDTIRNELYHNAGFRLYRVWESDNTWKESLGAFLLQCNKEDKE